MKVTAPPDRSSIWPADLVTVVILFVDQSQDEQVGAAFLGSIDRGAIRLRGFTATAGQVEQQLCHI